MSTKKQILFDDWQERLQLFTSGNRGRKSAIAANDMTIVEDHEFRDIEYDPIGKGNDLIITLGTMDNFITHTINAPVEIFFHQEENGEVSTLEIFDQNGETTLLRLLN